MGVLVNTDLPTLFGALREALATPSEASWRTICAVFSIAWYEHFRVVREQWMPYTERALERWPDDLRVCPEAWVYRLATQSYFPPITLTRAVAPLRDVPQLAEAARQARRRNYHHVEAAAHTQLQTTGQDPARWPEDELVLPTHVLEMAQRHVETPELRHCRALFLNETPCGLGMSEAERLLACGEARMFETIERLIINPTNAAYETRRGYTRRLCPLELTALLAEVFPGVHTIELRGASSSHDHDCYQNLPALIDAMGGRVHTLILGGSGYDPVTELPILALASAEHAAKLRTLALRGVRLRFAGEAARGHDEAAPWHMLLDDLPSVVFQSAHMVRRVPLTAHVPETRAELIRHIQCTRYPPMVDALERGLARLDAWCEGDALLQTEELFDVPYEHAPWCTPLVFLRALLRQRTHITTLRLDGRVELWPEDRDPVMPLRPGELLFNRPDDAHISPGVFATSGASTQRA